MSSIRIDCYLARLKDFKKEFPNCHFEIITRTAKSPLSPSWKLLKKAKDSNMPFKTYLHLLSIELENNVEAQKRIKELAEISRERDVFLVCYEKDSSKCHRIYIKDLIEKERDQ